MGRGRRVLQKKLAQREREREIQSELRKKPTSSDGPDPAPQAFKEEGVEFQFEKFKGGRKGKRGEKFN